MVVLLVVYLLVVHSYLYGLQDVHFDSGWHSLLVQLFCLPAPCCKDNGQRVHRRTIAAHIFTIAAQHTSCTYNSCTYTKLQRRAPSHDYYTLPVCAAQQPNYPLQRNIALKTLPSEILPDLGSLTIYIFRLSGWLFLQKWERKSWKKNETVAQISGRRCMTLGEVWPSFPDEGGAVQLSTLGGWGGGKSR